MLIAPVEKYPWKLVFLKLYGRKFHEFQNLVVQHVANVKEKRYPSLQQLP